MSALPDDIERLALVGWRLQPASSRSRAACLKEASTLATCDLDKLSAWAREFPNCNWRVVMEGSGIWALDVDVPSSDHAADGVTALAGLVHHYGPIPPRPMTRSGGGGVALFFRHRGEHIHGRTGWPAPGLDPRRGRLSVTVPPSRHHRTGRLYRWIVPPWQCDPPDAPQWLLRVVAPPPEPVWPARNIIRGQSDLRRAYVEAALRRAVERVATAREGHRNDTLNASAFGLTRFISAGDLAPAEIADALAVAARYAGMLFREVQATLASALSARRTTP
jgi:hypothetical protein